MDPKFTWTLFQSSISQLMTHHTHTHTKTRNLGIHMGISHSNGQFLFQTQRKAMPKSVKLPHNCTVAVISQASKVMLKILQARL